MSLYAIIKPNLITSAAAPGARRTAEKELVQAGEEAGIFTRVAGLQGQRGAVVQLATENVGEARLLLDALIYLQPDTITTDLIATAGAELSAGVESLSPQPMQQRPSDMRPATAQAQWPSQAHPSL